MIARWRYPSPALINHTIKPFLPSRNRYERSVSTASTNLQDLFLNPRIYNLLRLITFNDPKLTHQSRFRTGKIHNVKVLNEAELKTVLEYSSAFTTQRLQPPPVLNTRSDPKNIEELKMLSIMVDAKLQGLLPSNNKLVFTDISLGQSRRDRLIVIREPSGLLRHATPSERDRTNQIYFPLMGRSLRVPSMFEGQHLKNLLDGGQFLYLLDRACSQFEPDDPKFTAVCHAVYDRVAQLAWIPIASSPDHTDAIAYQTGVQTNPLRALRHTRYYAPLTLYMIAHLGQPGALLYEAIASRHYARAGWLLRLCSLIRPESKFATGLAGLSHKLPKEVVVVTSKNSHDHEMELNTTDVDDILASLEFFIDVEPLSSDQKDILRLHLGECQNCIKLDRSPG